MGGIVNLRRARKRKAREADEDGAAANRSLHGVPKRNRAAAKAEAGQEKRQLDAHRLDPKPSD